MDASFALLPLAFLTSTLTAAIGMGGGVLLVTLMPGLLPAAAILPVHAVTQLASNGSRVLFGWRALDVGLLPALLAGAILGAALGGGVYRSLDQAMLPAIIGVLILLIVWVPLPAVRGGGRLSLLLLGFYQTGLGMIAGATGPLGAAVLARHNTDRDYLVVNTGAYMTINHAVRTAAFAVLGFSFAAWWPLILGLAVAVIAGSWVGSRLRVYVPKRDFHRWFRALVSVLALRMIALSVF